MSERTNRTHITGQVKYEKDFKVFIAGLSDRQIVNSLASDGETMIAMMRRLINNVTSNLSRSLVSKPFAKQRKGEPAAFVAVDYNIAPHAHLVEFGHGGPKPAAPKPFFRPVVHAWKELKRTNETLKRYLAKANRRVR